MPPTDRRARRGVIALLLVGAAQVAAAAPANDRVPPDDVTPAHIQIVESVPTHSIYGEPGVPRTPDVWRAMIASARQHIDIAAFYVTDKPGEALAPVLDAIAARAKAGVTVRILTGPTFADETDKSLAPLAKLANVTIRRLPVDKLTGGVLHAKYFVVDDRQAFIGSANWDWRAMDQIHEIGARVDSPRMAQTLDAVFDFDWRLAADGDLPAARKRAADAPDFDPVTRQSPVPIASADGAITGTAFEAFSPPVLMPDWITAEQSALVRLIRSARRTLRIQVMTLSAINEYGAKGYWPALDSALRDAAARGVAVHIIVADWALREPMQAYLKSLAVLAHITVKYSHVPQAPRGLIPYARVEHCKYAVADDDAVYIGTGNWTRSYFQASVDASLFLHDARAAATLNHIFKRDWNGAYVQTIRPAGHYDAPRTH